MQRNLAQSLFQHGQIRTTLAKAKDLRPFAERLITLARKAGQGDLGARRRIHKLMSDRSFIPAEHQSTYDHMSDAKRHQAMVARSGRRHRTGAAKGRLDFTALGVTHKLINTIAPRFEDRPGGYTRIISLAERRLGDQGALAILQLVGDEESPGHLTKPAKTARRRRADARFAAVFKAAKAGTRRGKSADPKPESDSKDAPPEDADQDTT